MADEVAVEPVSCAVTRGVCTVTEEAIALTEALTEATVADVVVD